MKRLFSILSMMVLSTNLMAQSWVERAEKFDDDFYRTNEAIRIADNLLLYQHTTGAWPKNIDFTKPLNEQEKAVVIQSKSDINESTIDNRATTTEVLYLSHVYQATGNEKYKDAALAGINYLLEAQYDNGGWPQFWPRPKGYYTHITYNDNAMVNVMKLMRDASKRKAPFQYLSDEVAERCKRSFDLGITCILNTQIRQNDTLKVWCAQHDEHTLQPAKARAYELPSFSAAESCGITLLLMGISKPSQAIIDAVEGSVAWLKATQLEGIRVEFFTNEQGKRDRRVVNCPEEESCQPIWARFYTLDTCRPFFCGRDGVVRYNLSEIELERRVGYGWYTDKPREVLKKYEQWKKKLKNRKK